MTGIVSNAGRPDGVRLDVRTAALILVVAIGLSACGGGGSEPAAETVSPPAEPEPVASPLPGGSASTICSGETMPIPQYALTVAFDSLWVACRTEGAVLRVEAETGEVVARIPAEGAVSLAADDTSVWAVFRELGELYRIDPETNEVADSVSLFHDTPYIWAEAGVVWLGYGDGTEIGRLDPETMKVVARVPVGDGTSDIVADGDSLLVVCHRDHTLWRVDPATNTAEKLSDLPGDTPERLTLAAGSLWATGAAPTSSASTRRRGRRWRQSRPASAASSSPRSTARSGLRSRSRRPTARACPSSSASSRSTPRAANSATRCFRPSR